jgi:hypothetical protein
LLFREVIPTLKASAIRQESCTLCLRFASGTVLHQLASVTPINSVRNNDKRNIKTIEFKAAICKECKSLLEKGENFIKKISDGKTPEPPRDIYEDLSKDADTEQFIMDDIFENDFE